jgi:hypothetical protein
LRQAELGEFEAGKLRFWNSGQFKLGELELGKTWGFEAGLWD